MKPVLAIHGGAGDIRRDRLSDEAQSARRRALTEAVQAGRDVLIRGGDALKACVAAVVVLEDCPLFNAGRGSVYAADGSQQMDAAVMHGADRSVGAVAGVRTLRNPIVAAELVRTASPHVLMVGEDAERYAQGAGACICDPGWFYDADRWAHFERTRASGAIRLDHDDADEPKGTVGAVARDVHGHLAAATSTGGLSNKLAGRVGDSPIPGAGTFAWDATCAVSATGVGEAVLRLSAAARVSAWMEIGGLSLAQACDRVVLDELPGLGGHGGIIAVDRSGRIAMPFDSAGMYRAHLDTEGNVSVGIW